MGEDSAAGGIDYPGLVTAALKGVLRGVLRRAAESGFPGEHHLFISFRTGAPGVSVPARLRKEFPKEMTIVLQHQFWGLTVDEDAFSVQLRFGGILERLTVPWDALIAFADPSVPFGLRFATDDADGPPQAPTAVPAAESTPPPSRPEGEGKVVAFPPPRGASPPARRKPRR
jgi:hypothetical protein